MANIRSQLNNLRKKLDKVAELAWRETNTSQLLASYLGKPHWQKKTALIYKIGNGPVSVFFRAELDALNTTNGPKHVCGHSSHLAALALAYKTLSKHPPADKTIYFVFQPSEEGFPSGAKFISQSFIPITKCRAGFAFHVAPSSQLGTITDVRMAAADYFEINVTAKASHIKNKNTHTGGDAILIAAEIVRELNGVQSMENIVNVGTIKGGETPNAIASQTVLTGDIRALNTRQLKSARDYVQKLVSRFPQAQLSLFTGYPVLANDPYLVSLVKQYIPISGVRSTFGTEDFSLYPVPSVFLHIGTGQKAELHSLAFEVPAELVFTIYNYWLSISRIRF